MTRLMPPLAYYGGKVTIAEKIVRMLPRHEHYVEPFAGSLAVLLAKAPSSMETVNDLDGDLMAFWRVLRDRPADLERVCALTPHSRAEHAAAYQAATDELEQARRVWVRLTQGRGGTLRNTGWRHYVRPVGTTGMPDYLAAYVARIAAAAQRLAGVSLECRPALDVIASYGQHREVCLYVDPPYLGSTRTRNYRHEMSSEGQHRELAAALAACNATVVLSGYHSELYDELYADWHRVELDAHTGQAHDWQRRTEVLWSNRPFPNVTPSLFDEEPT
ncbi:DNA adenine methylase [Planobispora rosea]|uniref:DNA adenine methylase n=1 Tax=Planobispora rosea TaxID=35762 RepID=UPI000A4A3B08|nr:DNA adenine methylase [Planobispora rosea]